MLKKALLPLISSSTATCFALLINLTTSSVVSAQGAKPLPGSAVLAVVNDHQITVDELNQEMSRPDIKAAIESLQNQPQEIEKLRKSVLNSMIDKDLLIKAATASKAYKPDEVNSAFEAIISEQGGQDTIQPILSSYGTSWDAFKSDMKDRLTIEQFIERDLLANVKISEDELKSTFTSNVAQYAQPETVTARHILVLVKPQASEEDRKQALAKIEEIRKRATAADADFGKIASETSDDTASKVDGGNLGAFQRGQMVPEFEKAAFELKVGEISAPVKTDYGYHLIKVEKHEQPSAPNFESAKGKVKADVMAKLQDKVISEKIAELRAAAKIDYKVN